MVKYRPLNLQRKYSQNRNVNIESISFSQFIKEESVQNYIFEILFPADESIGLSLTLEKSGQVIVKDLGRNTMASNCGCIEVGDQLVSINEHMLERLNFGCISDLLRKFDFCSKRVMISYNYL